MISISKSWSHFLCTAVLLVGCGGSQKDATEPNEVPVTPAAEPVSPDPEKSPEGTPPTAEAAPPVEAVPESHPAAPRITAMAELKGDKGATVGTVNFEEVDGGIKITATFSGLKPGMHAFVVHESAECKGKDGGAHFNPSKQKHGPAASATRHSGDFGNITADETGNATFEMTTDSVTLKEGPDSLVGHTIAVHAKKDDGKTQPSGNSGAMLGCGKIERSDQPVTSSR